jgi:hypothetical protein
MEKNVNTVQSKLQSKQQSSTESHSLSEQNLSKDLSELSPSSIPGPPRSLMIRPDHSDGSTIVGSIGLTNAREIPPADHTLNATQAIGQTSQSTVNRSSFSGDAGILPSSISDLDRSIEKNPPHRWGYIIGLDWNLNSQLKGPQISLTNFKEALQILIFRFR